MTDTAEVKTPEELFKAAEAMKASNPDYLVEDFGAVQGGLENVLEHAEVRNPAGDVHEKATEKADKVHTRAVNEEMDGTRDGPIAGGDMETGTAAAIAAAQEREHEKKKKDDDDFHRFLRLLEDHAKWLGEQIEDAKEEFARVQKDNEILEGTLQAHKEGSPLSAAQIALMDKYYKDANGEYNWDRAKHRLINDREREEELKIEIKDLESDLKKTNENIQKINNGENPVLRPEDAEYLRARSAVHSGSDPFNKPDDQLSGNPISAKNIKQPFKVAAGGEEPQMGASDELTKKVMPGQVLVN